MIKTSEQLRMWIKRIISHTTKQEQIYSSTSRENFLLIGRDLETNLSPVKYNHEGQYRNALKFDSCLHQLPLYSSSVSLDESLVVYATHKLTVCSY